MKSNLDRGYFSEPEQDAPAHRFATRTVFAAVALVIIGAVGGSATRCVQEDIRYPSTFSATESAGRIWQLLDSDRAAAGEIKAHALNIYAQAERAVTDLTTIAERAEEPLRSQILLMVRRIGERAEQAAPAVPDKKD